MKFIRKLIKQSKCIPWHRMDLTHNDMAVSKFEENKAVVTVCRVCKCGKKTEKRTFIVPFTNLELEDLLRLATRKARGKK